MQLKTCLVIGHFGSKGSFERKRSDTLMESVICPVTRNLGIEAKRIIDENRPGELTFSVMRRLHESDLVIADLTDRNANAFYELGVRHTTGRPTILMSFDAAETIPFNIRSIGVILMKLDMGNWIQPAGQELESQIGLIQRDDPDVTFSTSAYLAAEAYREELRRTKGIVGYDWIINYERNLAENWLGRQTPQVQQTIDQFRSAGEVVGEIATDKGKLDLLAEYLGYRSASGCEWRGSLYCENKGNNSFDGSAVLLFTGTAEAMSAQVSGVRNGNDQLELHFFQRPRSYAVSPGIEGYVKAFTYTIIFKRASGDPKDYEGILEHPGFLGLVVANTRLHAR